MTRQLRRRDPDVIRARASQYIDRLLAETPPLTAEERRDLTRLLTAPDRGQRGGAS